MSRFAGLALVLLMLASSCSRPEAPLDPTSQALEHLHEHNYDEAIRSASEAIAQSHNNAAAHLYRGRAYYYRAAMGDTHLAIKDLSEAIRLAPDSSDAYYVRALLYRELGETDLADKDDARARELDHVARAVFDSLPDSPPPLDLSKMKPVNTGKNTEEPAKSAAEMLKETEAAASKSGADGTAKSASSLAESFASDPGDEAPAPVESAFNKQYRALLGKGTSGEEPLPADTPTKDLFGRSLEGGKTASVPPPTTGGAAPLPGGEASNGSSAGRNAAGWSQMPAQPLQSPFARQTPGAANSTRPGTTPGMLPNVQSPFPQAGRKATGYVPPVSPFGAPGGQASGAAGVSRPFGSPGTTVRPQNDAVRPPFARDYLP